MTNMQLIHQLYLFKELSSAQVELIADIAEETTYNPGDEVFSQGDRATSMYVVSYGSIKIQAEENGEMIEITRLGPGSHFGEMPFLDAEPRSASAVAIEKTALVVIDYEKLSKLLRAHQDIAVHVYAQFAAFLCNRLRFTTKDLSFARSQVISHF